MKDSVKKTSLGNSTTVYPDWINEHEKVVNGAFNLYSPMFYQPVEGDWGTIYKFLKHIFQGKGSVDFATGEEYNFKGDTFTVALDYLNIQYVAPTHLLPVPMLVSTDQQTGKSTFLRWLSEVYKGNSTILNDEQFKMDFNNHYISKYIIGFDGVNLKDSYNKERLIKMVTADTVYIEEKGVDVTKIPFYGKVIMTSNDAESIMKMDENDKRWFVINVPSIEEDNLDPDLELKMKKEIPAFLYYLRTRKPFHQRKTRLWFETEDILKDN